jgi:preprotein translocase SecF subunit
VFDVIGKRNWFFLFSGLILVPGLIFIILTPVTGGKQGLQFSVDYTGGTVWDVQFKNPNVTTDQVKAVFVANGITDAEVTQDSAKYFTIRTKDVHLFPEITQAPATPTINPSASASAAVAASASAALTPSPSPSPTATPSASASAGASASASASASPSASASASASPTPAVILNGIDQSGNPCPLQLPVTGKLAGIAAVMQADPKIGPIACTRETTTVGPIISSELITQTIELILLGSLGILIWVGVRFGSIKFGATALVALLHDVIVVVGIFAILGTLFGVQIDALFVTAMLTVIGFSVHDTIVVYDRIRENKSRHAGEPFDQIVNHSVLQTFGRSINTSLTVVITLTALLLFAGASIHYFVLALLIGIISGTYSSIFNASPLLVVWQLWEDNRRAKRIAAIRGPRRA